MARNVPDDWDGYYQKCHECGDMTHASEGYACSCADNTWELIETELTTDDKGRVFLVETYEDEDGNRETCTERYWVGQRKSD